MLGRGKWLLKKPREGGGVETAKGWARLVPEAGTTDGSHVSAQLGDLEGGVNADPDGTW